MSDQDYMGIVWIVHNPVASLLLIILLWVTSTTDLERLCERMMRDASSTL